MINDEPRTQKKSNLLNCLLMWMHAWCWIWFDIYWRRSQIKLAKFLCKKNWKEFDFQLLLRLNVIFQAIFSILSFRKVFEVVIESSFMYHLHWFSSKELFNDLDEVHSSMWPRKSFNLVHTTCHQTRPI